MAMRAYELSKKLGISNKDLLELLKEHGYSLSNIAVVPDEAVALVEKIFKDRTSPQREEQPAPIVEKKEVALEQPLHVQKAPEKPQKEQKKEERKVFQPRPAPAPRMQKQQQTVELEPQEIPLVAMSVGDFAEKARKHVSDVIVTLLKQGTIATKNQLLPEKTVALLAQTYGLTLAQPPAAKIAQEEKKSAVSQEGTWVERLPVVVVIGHVDHGKTTLLDYIRKTRVAAKEKGGITQHLGAYEVKTDHGNLVFLDTPGHEAFSFMRARGIRVADIAILVIAADDGVMPQTLEAITRAKAAQIPLIVALNKIDKATPAQIETVKRQLAQHDLVPEEWGGQTVVLPISAKIGTGIDHLLEVLVLQAQLMDLKANLTIPARGFVLEAKIEKGRGPVATVITQHGILHVGDYFISDSTSGKVSSLVDSFGKRVQEVSPSMPVQVAGFSELPQAGSIFEVSTAEAIKKGIAAQPLEVRSDLYLKKGLGEKEIALIVKADNGSSKEALVHALKKIDVDARKVTIVAASVGDISESDVMLAADTGALLYAFHVKTSSSAVDLAQKKGVTIKSFDIIYKLLEDVEALLHAGKPIKMVSKKIGEAVVLKVFDIKGLGIIAGAHVKTGRFVRDGKVIVWRGKQKVGEGAIRGLQRERKSVKEVHAGFECGFLVDGFDTWEVDDRVECFQEVPA